MIQNIADLVDANGKTIRENNNAVEHAIPLGALVEINAPDQADNGLRLFVHSHIRDCDGTPLYILTHRYDLVGQPVGVAYIRSLAEDPERKELAEKTLTSFIANQREGATTGGYPESALITIRLNKELKNAN